MLINRASRQDAQKRLPMSSRAVEKCSGSSDLLPRRVDFLHKSGMANGSPLSTIESMFTARSSVDIPIQRVGTKYSRCLTLVTRYDTIFPNSPSDQLFDQDMPPKKRARLPSGAVSTPSIETQDAQTPIPATPDAATKVGTATLDPLNDPWTDEQETSLYKGVIRWKPVGQSECTVIS